MHGILSKIRNISNAIGNQLLSSGTNFLLGLYLVREMEIENFGIYGIFYAVLLFVTGIYSSYLITPLIVSSGEQKGNKKYIRSVFDLLSFLSVSMFVFVSLVTFVLYLNNIIKVEPYVSVFSILMASFFSVIKEFCVRMAFAFNRAAVALRINLIISVLFLFSYVLLEHFHVSINHNIAFFVCAFSYLIPSIYGLIILGFSNRITLTSIKLGYEYINIDGRWSGLNFIIYFLKGHSYTLIVGGIIGPVGVAKINAARIFVSPFVMLMPAMTNYLLPWFSNIKNDINVDLVRTGFRVTLILVSFSFFYSLVVLFVFDEIYHYVLKDDYRDVFSILVVHCLIIVFSTGRNSMELVLHSLSRFKENAKYNAIATIIVITSTFLLCKLFDEEGALFGLFIGEAAVFTFLYSSLKKNRIFRIGTAKA